MKYLVEFEEKAIVKRTVQCEVEAESEEDAELELDALSLYLSTTSHG